MMKDFGAELTAMLRPMLAYAMKLTKNKDLAEDLLQSVCARALIKQHLYVEEGGGILPWLLTMMHREFINQIRFASKRNSIFFCLTEAMTYSVPDIRNYPADERLYIQELIAEIKKLPDRIREPLLQVTLENLTYEDIAEKKAVPVGTVRSRISRARERLRKFGKND